MSFSIHTTHLQLKILDSSYAPQVLDFYERNRSIFDCYEPTRPSNFYSTDFQKMFLEYEYHEIVKGKTLRYYMFLPDAPDMIIGSVNFSNIVHGPFSRASLGYKLDAQYHGHGYATEACRAAIKVAFDQYRLHRLEARVAPSNHASIRLLERLQFVYEGIEYSGVEVNGTFQDHYRYGLITPHCNSTIQ